MSLIFTAAIPTEFLPLAYLVVFALGAVIGSFLNVYIYRFHTGKSLAGSSHCLSCGVSLSWYELFPIFSFLVIRGRCRHCYSRVPIRYFLVELTTAFLFLLSLLISTIYFKLAILWLISAILVVILVYDYYHFIIPDSLTVVFAGLVIVLLGHSYFINQTSLAAIGSDFMAALLGSGFFLLLWLISKGQWLGFGDVKLAFPLGLLVGAKSVFSFIVISFWIGACVSLMILAIQYLRRGKSHLRLVTPAITMKSAVPFAPFLISGALLTFFAKINVLSFFYFVI